MKIPRFHLTTAIVLMFTAAGIIWLNVRPLKKAVIDYEVTGDTYEPVVGVLRNPGWPLSFLKLEHRNIDPFIGDGATINIVVTLGMPPLRPRKIVFSSLAIDIAIALAILAVAAIGTELIIRDAKTKPARALSAEVCA